MQTSARIAALCTLAAALASTPAPGTAEPARGPGQSGAARAGEPPSQAARPAAARASVAGKPGALPSKRTASNQDNPQTLPSSSGDAPAAWWHDGERRRELRMDPARVADFRAAAAAGKSVTVRARDDAEKAAPALPAGVSPVFVDPASPGQVRALPGGVIVTLRQPPAGNDAAAREAETRRQLAAAGLQPLRPIGPDARSWLVASPPGMPALELANRLLESGEFASAAPNWWQPRALK